MGNGEIWSKRWARLDFCCKNSFSLFFILFAFTWNTILSLTLSNMFPFPQAFKLSDLLIHLPIDGYYVGKACLVHKRREQRSREGTVQQTLTHTVSSSHTLSLIYTPKYVFTYTNILLLLCSHIGFHLFHPLSYTTVTSLCSKVIPEWKFEHTLFWDRAHKGTVLTFSNIKLMFMFDHTKNFLLLKYCTWEKKICSHVTSGSIHI